MQNGENSVTAPAEEASGKSSLITSTNWFQVFS